MKIPIRIKILSLVFVLLAVLAYFSLQEKLSTDTITKGDNEVAIKDTADINKITIQKDGQTQVLTKNEKSVWKINNKFEVRENVIGLLLVGLHEIEIKRPVSEEQKNKVKELLKSKGAKVTIDYNGKTKTLLFATNENDINTTFLLPENSEIPYVAYIPGVPGDINNVFKFKEIDWRNRDLFHSNPGEIQSLTIAYPSDAAGSFDVYFKSGVLLVKDVSPLDTNRLYQYLEFYRYAPVSGYIEAKPDSIERMFSKAKQYATINLTDINATKSNSIVIYQDPENKKSYLGKVGKDGEVVLVNKELFDRLLVKKSLFIAK